MNRPTTAHLIVRVAAGAVWLDEHQPGWFWRVDLGRLDVRRTCRCLLAQLFGDYAAAPLSAAQAVALGFDTSVGASTTDRGPDVDEAITDEFANLTELWRIHICHRRSTARGLKVLWQFPAHQRPPAVPTTEDHR